MTRSAVKMLFACAAFACLGQVPPMLATPSEDNPLAGSEFDKEISLKVREVPLTKVFEMVSGATGTPFVADPGLERRRITLTLTQVPARSALEMMAKGYGLVFVRKGDAIAVFRRPASGGAVYDFQMAVRRGADEVVSRPRVSTLAGSCFELKQSIDEGKKVLRLNSTLPVLEEYSDHVLALNVCIVKDSDGGGVDVLGQITSGTVLEAGHRYIEERQIFRKTLARDATDVPLATSSDGVYHVILTRLEVKQAPEGR